jgi:hypothetical protein
MVVKPQAVRATRYNVVQSRDRRFDTGDGDQRIGVAVDPPHRNLHVGQPETPVPPKQSGIVDHGLAAAMKDIEHVVDEYRLVFRVGEDPLVILGPHAGVAPVGVMGDRDKRRQQPATQRGQRPAQLREHRVEAAGNVGDTTVGGLGADRRDDAVQHGDGGHPRDQRGQRATGQREGATAGEAHDAEPLGIERVGHLRHVGDPVGHRVVAMSVR